MVKSNPDLRVAVDFGTTYTGVSWDTPQEKNNTINIIDTWPGEEGTENKVPTILEKDRRGDKKDWGFHCKALAHDKKWKLFKLLLDPIIHGKQVEGERNGWVPETMELVRNIVVRYLSRVYTYISKIIPDLIREGSFSPDLQGKDWTSMKVEFIFSTPTTWTAPISQCFRSLVLKAGFGRYNHSVILGLTEAEASAVFTAKGEEIINNSIFLAIDAGGGTTDLAFVRKIKSSFTLEEIPVAGIPVGSTKVDKEFARLIEQRIDNNPSVSSHLPTDFAWKASQSADFQTLKHKFGSANWEQGGGEYSTRVAEANNYTHADFRISDGELLFTEAELRQCFDITLNKIKLHIKRELRKATSFEGAMTRKRIDHIVISGGLGSSEYVLNELEAYIASLACEPNSCVAGAAVFLPAQGDARMVVVKGLLDDRQSKSHTLREYVARANYAITMNPSTPGSTASTSASIEEIIHWRLKYGDTIKACEPTTIRFIRKLGDKGPWRWTVEIMWVDQQRSRLPPNRIEG
ncbi:hypothetical protein H9Q69_000312 [Fusarium xylarioides]|nr:hypothetical protein H9Q69_000312 [Fusarium xylarioides]KAG5804781.1 hypothetical protein H9Q71_010649 [Fusarium xylarioides]KAG5818856.1 hypothetical protein H9Q74_009821 [Fusarium xylarioides]